MIKCEIRADDTLHIEGYVNAVERDSDPLVAPNIGKCVEQIRAGAFGAALASGGAVEILENHDRSRKLGSTAEGNLSLREDSIGLRAAADITDKEVIEKARTGQLKGWSFGFTPTDYEIEARADNIPRRIVKALKLSEVSLIDGQYKPCYPGTLVEVRADGMVEFRSDEDVEVVENKVDETTPDYGYYERCIKLHELDASNKENRAEILDIYHSLWYDYLTELRYNHNHDPSNGRFCSGGGGGKSIAKAQRNISQREMANGMRKPASHILNDDEIQFVRAEINAIGADESIFRFNSGNQTGYVDSVDIINIRGDVFPDQFSNHPRDCMSVRAVIAHEYYGHRQYRSTKLEIGSWNDEFRASYMAAKNCPNLSDIDKYYLICDAVERSREHGVTIKYNSYMKKVLYGY